MIKKIAIDSIIASFFCISSAFADNNWKECSDRIESQMYEKGQCGASGCFDQKNRSIEDIVAEKCGYPKSTDKEAAQIIEDLRNLPSESVRRAAMQYPPDSEVRSVLDEIDNERQKQTEKYIGDLKKARQISIDRVYALTDNMTVAVIRTNKNVQVRCTVIGPSGNYVAVQDATIEPPAEEVGIYTGGAIVESVSCILR